MERITIEKKTTGFQVHDYSGGYFCFTTLEEALDKIKYLIILDEGKDDVEGTLE